jgi:hypothetical protein
MERFPYLFWDPFIHGRMRCDSFVRLLELALAQRTFRGLQKVWLRAPKGENTDVLAPFSPINA